MQRINIGEVHNEVTGEIKPYYMELDDDYEIDEKEGVITINKPSRKPKHQHQWHYVGRYPETQESEFICKAGLLDGKPCGKIEIVKEK